MPGVDKARVSELLARRALEKIGKVLNKKPEARDLTYSKLTPEYIKLTPAPLEINLGKQTIDGAQYDISAHVYSVGVVSILFSALLSLS